MKNAVGLELRDNMGKAVIVSDVAMFEGGAGPRFPGITNIDSQNRTVSLQTMIS
jgi:hypothetical protein